MSGSEATLEVGPLPWQGRSAAEAAQIPHGSLWRLGDQLCQSLLSRPGGLNGPLDAAALPVLLLSALKKWLFGWFLLLDS